MSACLDDKQFLHRHIEKNARNDDLSYVLKALSKHAEKGQPDICQNVKYEKPLCSYVWLIMDALKNAQQSKATLQQIYEFVEKKYPYFKHLPTKDRQGWQNSIRHNLSLNDCFLKVPRDGVGPSHYRKGNYWTLAAGYDFDTMFEPGNCRRRRRMKRPNRNIVPGVECSPWDPFRSLLSANWPAISAQSAVGAHGFNVAQSLMPAHSTCRFSGANGYTSVDLFPGNSGQNGAPPIPTVPVHFNNKGLYGHNSFGTDYTQRVSADCNGEIELPSSSSSVCNNGQAISSFVPAMDTNFYFGGYCPVAQTVPYPSFPQQPFSLV